MRFPVTEKKNDALAGAMKRLGIREADLRETFVRSGGPGGQNVNKVSTCVVLKHIPTGLSVRCQQERSQAMNRFLARSILLKKLDARIRGRESAEAHRIAKIKRQKRKRSKRAKDKMLDAKKKQGQKKTLRRTVGPEES
ncbi:MAG: peptide chain release factor-like protein [Candidatus Omnitrophota bacterium]|nr:peptide chain release factor-like protein [Candidatus Omnitrophota bacterium]